MLDAHFVRSNPELVKQNITNRGLDLAALDVDKWLSVDLERSRLLQEQDELNRRRNELAEMGKNKQIGLDELKRISGENKEKQKQVAADLEVVLKEWTELLSQFPNMHDPKTPIGKSDKENVVVRKVGEPTKFDFAHKDHLTLGKELEILDFEGGSKVAGSQFYYLKNDAVLLEFGLIQYGLNFLAKKGFTPVLTPDMAKSRFYLGTGYAPRGDEAQTYEIKDEDLGLIATAEVTMAGLYADEIIPYEKLPLKFAAISHCFRREAGAYGKYSKGLYRVHQFSKLEMFVYCLPEQSQQIHEELLAIEEEIAQSLDIPYQVVEMCTGDLGGMAARKFDIEAWMPGRNDYGEVTSTSNCTDYQARNLNIRYRNQDGKVDFLHMLNGTAIVMSRFPIAIMENFQQADGRIKVPKALVPFVGKEYLSKN